MALWCFSGLFFDEKIFRHAGGFLQAGLSTRSASAVQERCSLLQLSQINSVEPRA